MKSRITYHPQGKNINKKWYVLDASGKTLGRFASNVAAMLIGKNKTIYSPDTDVSDYYIIINADKIVVTGKKEKDKIYYRHSGYRGGLKKMAYEKLKQKNPKKILENAIFGMLPKNKLAEKISTKIKIYAGSTHPHKAQNPEAINI